jgi:hypothetical protein
MSKPAATRPPRQPAREQVPVTRHGAKPPEPGVSDAEASRRIRAYVAEHPGSVALGLPWRRVKRIAGDLVSKGQLTEQE